MLASSRLQSGLTISYINSQIRIPIVHFILRGTPEGFCGGFEMQILIFQKD